MEMTRMKISKYKPIILVSGIFCSVFLLFLSVVTLKDISKEAIDLKNPIIEVVEYHSASSSSGLKYNSVSIDSVSTGVSHEVDEEEYF
jgi:hypothetical protein